MKELKKNNSLFNDRGRRNYRLSDEAVIADFLQEGNNKAETQMSSFKNDNLGNSKGGGLSSDTMAYKINQSGFLLELLKEKEKRLQVVGN